MALRRHTADFTPLSADTIAGFRALDVSVVGDAMNREHVMGAAIKPLAPGMRLCGQARTVSAMAGDNSAGHLALSLANEGEVLVIDGGGLEDVAVWGEVMTRAAMMRGIAGVVLDGATRDAAAIRELGFPMFCRAVVPRGPHKGFGGTLDGTISAGGVAITPGDLVIGDDDGVAVVPLGIAAAVLAAARDSAAREEQWLKAIAEGRSTADLLGISEPEVID